MTFSLDGLMVSKILLSTLYQAQQLLFPGCPNCKNTFDEFVVDEESCRLLVAAMRRLKLFDRGHDE